LHQKWIPWDCSFGITLYENEKLKKFLHLGNLTAILDIAVENGHENKVF
jgi:hypothetical protein